MSQNAEQTLVLTIELPEPVFRLLSRLGELTQQSPETLAAQSIAGNLPPLVENAPSEMQAELLAMQSLSNDELLEIAYGEVPPAQQVRHLALLAKNSAASITADEQQELSQLRMAADRLICFAFTFFRLNYAYAQNS